MQQLLADTLEAVKHAAGALAPAALGSAVAQAYQRGLSWRDRLVQWVVGIAVSWYATMGLGALLHFDRFVAQSVGFVIATIAFQATPKFIAGAGDVVASLPAEIRERLLALLPGRASPKKDVEP